MKEQDTITTSKNEIMEAESNFAEMAASEGIADAFLFYAAEDAVLMRNNKLVTGKNRLSEYFDKQAPPGTDVSLSWKPDFVDVSSQEITRNSALRLYKDDEIKLDPDCGETAN